MKKTNAIRTLDQLEIQYELLEYRYDPEHLDVGKIAVDNQLQIEQVYKTLVAKGDKTGILVAVVPGDKNLNLKALSQVSGNKKTTLLPVKDLQKVTGYIRGGCSPLGMKKPYAVWIEETARRQKKIFVNAGKRGLLVGLQSEDLKRSCSGEFVPIAE